MIEIEVKVDDLLRWAWRMNCNARKTPAAIARAINTYGDGVMRSTVEYIVDQTGMEPDDVVDLIQLKQAEPDDLNWEMDATAAMRTVGDEELFSRPFETRDNSRFEQERLVKIVTMNDGHDCEICAEAAQHSPYTMSEIETMQAKWAGYEGRGGPAGPANLRTNLIHPNCRCTIAPWYATRRMPVTFRERGAGRAPPELLTPNQLARAVRNELILTIEAKDDDDD